MRITQMVKVTITPSFGMISSDYYFLQFMHQEFIRFGEVMYYFVVQLSEEEEPHNLAMISMTSLLDGEILEKSSGALRVCNFDSGKNLVVVEVTSIQGVVSLLPFPLMHGEKLLSDEKFFVIKDFGQELSVLTESATNLYDPDAEDPEENNDE
jgi:hypothetical protein